MGNQSTPESELDLFEQALNSMFQGTVSTLFRSILAPGGMEPTMESKVEPTDQGDDFKQLVNKHRSKTGQEPLPQTPKQEADMIVHGNSRANNLFDILSPMHQQEQEQDTVMPLFNLIMSTARDTFHHNDNNDINNTFTFTSTSTSQRRIIHSDGTEETVYSTTRNGNTEVVHRLVYPDGTVEETRQNSNSGRSNSTNVGSLFTHKPSSIEPPRSNETAEPAPEGWLSRMWQSFWTSRTT